MGERWSGGGFEELWLVDSFMLGRIGCHWVTEHSSVSCLQVFGSPLQIVLEARRSGQHGDHLFRKDLKDTPTVLGSELEVR